MMSRSAVAVYLLWICVKETATMMDSEEAECVPTVYKKCDFNTGICYTIETHDHCKLSWDDARIKCKGNVASSRDGKLAIINTGDIHNFLVAPDGWILEGSTENENGQSKYGDPEMFVGLRRKSGTWTWLDGSGTTYTKWKGGEPKNGKHCVTVKRKGGGGGGGGTADVEWKSKSCNDDPKNYICQYNIYCPAGYGGEQCIMCDIGTYKDSVGNGQCSSCDSTETTTQKGSDNIDDCVCKRGYGGSNRTECDVGSYKNTTGPGECTQCGITKTTKSKASTSRAECVCSPGYTGYTGFYCRPCERGKYKSTNGLEPCVPCGTGRTTNSTAASSELSCVCDVGHGGSDCKKCSIGSYKAVIGPDNCTRCGNDLTTPSIGATLSSFCVSPLQSTCELDVNQLIRNHIVPPQFTTIVESHTVTLECESGWTYLNSDTCRTLTCTDSYTWNATLEACEVNTECAAIPDSERVECGWAGISRLKCEANMCCYVGSSSTANPSCYFKGNRSTIVNVEDSTCIFHGKEYSFVSTAGPMNTSCPSDYPSLATLRYVAEFHLLRMCLSLLETAGITAQDRWIGGSTSVSHHISDLADYYPQPGTGNNCVTMSTRRVDRTHVANAVNLFKKECSETAFPICFKHLDVMTLLVSDPMTDGSCKVFDVGDYLEIPLWQTFTITDPTSKGYSLLRYEMKGLRCEYKTLLFSTTKGNATTCQKTSSCEVVKRMPRSKECFRMCPCDAGRCQSTVVVEPMTNQNQWSLCPLRLA